jgi:hypothetical protein
VVAGVIPQFGGVDGRRFGGPCGWFLDLLEIGLESEAGHVKEMC